jgi:hypothetical protein
MSTWFRQVIWPTAAASGCREDAPQEPGHGDGRLVGQYFGVGDPGAIVDADVDKRPPDATHPDPPRRSRAISTISPLEIARGE